MTAKETPARRSGGHRRLIPAASRALASLLVALALVLTNTGMVLAADEDDGGPHEQPSHEVGARSAVAQTGANPEANRKAYMTLLFQEINVRRDKAAAPRYDYMADTGSEAVNAYLHDLLPAMVAERSCFHGSDHPGSRAGWDYLEDVGIETELVGGEVLACPDVQAGGFWTPPGIADGWWKSPSHFKTLYGDVNVRIVACGAQEPIKGGLAYETVACLTLKGEK
jgi:hypothetical protein